MKDEEEILELAKDEDEFGRLAKALPDIGNSCMTFGSEMLNLAPSFKAAKTEEERLACVTAAMKVISKFQNAMIELENLFA